MYVGAVAAVAIPLDASAPVCMSSWKIRIWLPLKPVPT
jgi:hypothetical protein